MNHRELVLGTKSRSGPAVGHLGGGLLARRAPTATRSGSGTSAPATIDHEVAAYWRENYDLSHILRRDWATLGPKLEGKIHIYVGDMDNYYLNNAVYLVEEFLESTHEPVLRRRGRLRRPRRALLERRPHPAQRHLAPALPPDVRPEDRGADPEDGAPRRRPHELALLSPPGDPDGQSDRYPPRRQERLGAARAPHSGGGEPAVVGGCRAGRRAFSATGVSRRRLRRGRGDPQRRRPGLPDRPRDQGDADGLLPPGRGVRLLLPHDQGAAPQHGHAPGSGRPQVHPAGLRADRR